MPNSAGKPVCETECTGTCSVSGKCHLRQSAEDVLKQEQFKKQLHKWGHHHHLPHWAEEQLFKHMEQEIKRRKEADKYNATVTNCMNPMKWKEIWHHTHMEQGDIAFPVHAPHMAHTHPNSPNKSPTSVGCVSPVSPLSGVELLEEDTQIEDEALMTDDLLHEIMDDDEDDCPSMIIEHAGATGTDPWQTTVPELCARNPLHTRHAVHENTIRSIALVNPKPGDPRPGITKLNTEMHHCYGKINKQIEYDPHLSNNPNRGILAVQDVPLADCEKKSKR